MMRRTALALAILAATASATAAQGACSGPAAAFDFWIGDWEVTDRAGTQLYGRNVITRVAGNCAIREDWTAGASHGISLNMYDAVRKDWTQVWMDTAQRTLHLTGGWNGTAMVLAGRRADGGTNRITWTPMADGRVRQHWEQSVDGVVWTTYFDGYCRKRR